MSSQRLSATTIFIFASIFLTACASKGIRGHEPFITLNNLELNGNEIVLDLGVRNVNSLPIKMANIEFSLGLEGTSLAVYNAASNAQIFANGTENLRFHIPVTEDGRAMLISLQEGEFNNIEYVLEGEITDVEELKLEIYREGYLYRVPGRPGQFR